VLDIGHPARWLTVRRIRMHGFVLAVCLWTAYAAILATPGMKDHSGLIKGTDFLHFYTLGTLANEGRGDLLYDIPGQEKVVARVLPEAAGYRYVPLYGPQVSLLFAPVARLPYGWALTVWLALNAAIYAACCYVIWKTCSSLQDQGWTAVILAAAFPGIFHLLLWGQTSGLALACFTLGYLALRTQHDFLAGLAIGSLIFKPQLGLAAAVVFVLAGQWKVVAGAVTAMAAQLAAGWGHYGNAVMRDYANALLHVQNMLPWLEPRPYQMHSLRSFWSLIVPWPEASFVLYLISALAALALLVLAWRRGLPLELRFSALLFSTVLVSPHLTAYDLVILAPAFLLLVDWSRSPSAGETAGRVQLLLYLSYPLFLLGPVVRYIHVQLSVVAMFALLWFIVRSGVRPKRPFAAG